MSLTWVSIDILNIPAEAAWYNKQLTHGFPDPP
jgi:hypothetical protein